MAVIGCSCGALTLGVDVGVVDVWVLTLGLLLMGVLGIDVGVLLMLSVGVKCCYVCWFIFVAAAHLYLIYNFHFRSWNLVPFSQIINRR